MSDLATKVVSAMERLDSTSAAVLRHAAYRAMQEAGVDVAKLVHEARAAIVADRKARAERAVNNDARLTALAAMIPELSARVRGPSVGVIREMLDKWETVDGKRQRVHSVDAIQVALGVDRALVRDIRDLDRARAAKNKLNDRHKGKIRDLLESVLRVTSRPAWSAAPTKERKRHLGEGEEFQKAKVVGEQETHSTHKPIDQIRDMLTEQEYDAAKRLYDAYSNMQPGSKVGSLDGGGGGSDPATKLGVTPKQQQGGREWAALWPKLATGLRFTAQNLILQRPWAGDERALTLVELGRRVGIAGGPDQARGVAQGMLKATCAALAQISKEYDGQVKALKRQVFKSILTHPDVMHYIADGDSSTASGLMCKRTNLPAWVIYACVNKAVRMAENAPPRGREKAA